MSEAHGHWQLQAGGSSKKHKTFRDNYFSILIVYIVLAKKIIVLVSVQNTSEPSQITKNVAKLLDETFVVGFFVFTVCES